MDTLISHVNREEAHVLVYRCRTIEMDALRQHGIPECGSAAVGLLKARDRGVEIQSTMPVTRLKETFEQQNVMAINVVDWYDHSLIQDDPPSHRGHSDHPV